MSYRITINGEPFCSSHAEETAILNPKLKLQANTAGALTFTILPDHPYYDKINDRQSMFDVYLNDELIFEGTPVSQSTDFYNRKTVECEGELTWLNDTIQRQAVYSNQTVDTLLAAYLTVHNAQADLDKQFSLGTVTVNGGSGIYRFTNYSNTMTEIGEDLIDNFGGFLRVRHSGGTRYLDYLASSPRTSSQVIRIGKNLVDLTKNLSSLDICTVLIPLGAKEENQVVPGLDARLTIKSVNNDKDYIVGTAAAYFGNIWRTNVWDDVTTAAALKSKAEDYLTDAQWENLVISASAIDLGLTDDDVQQFRVLDMIRVVSEPHGIDRYFMLTKLDIDLNHPGQTQITLGEQKTVGLSAKTSQVAQEVEHQESTILVNASEHARQILETATGGCVYFHYDQYGVCDEIRIMNTNDPDTATKIWRWNIGGWGYSDDGGQSYTVAATMDGVIYANMIKAGILSSDNGEYSVNLDTGEAFLSNATIGGWKLNDHAIYSEKVYNGTTYKPYMLAPTGAITDATKAYVVETNTGGVTKTPFYVTYGGDLVSSSATITGGTMHVSQNTGHASGQQNYYVDVFSVTNQYDDGYTKIAPAVIDQKVGSSNTQYKESVLSSTSLSFTNIDTSQSISKTLLMNGSEFYLSDGGSYVEFAPLAGSSLLTHGLAFGTNAHNRVILNENGLFFYNASGTLTKSYPAT